MNQAEFDAAGIPFGTTGQRMDRLARVASMLDGMLPGVPIWIGSKGGPKGLRIVAESADGWNVVWRMDPQTYAQRLDVLAERCDRYKRDPRAIKKSVGLYCLIGENDNDVWRRFDAWRAFIPGILDGAYVQDFAADTLVGTPEHCAARVKEFEALGVEEIILGLGPVPFSVAQEDQLDMIAAELLPTVR